MKGKFKLAKVGKNFDEELREIKIGRRVGVDKKFPKEISTERLTDGIIKFPEWQDLKIKLMKEPRNKDKEDFKNIL